eukprot:Skav206569  [mRNA]  locus=scaffold925:192697:208066:- [translate_table: standard]
MGQISHMIRSSANGAPGHLSKVGLHTFADPRNGGGKRNKFTTKDLVKIQLRYDPTLSGELKPLTAAQQEELPWEGRTPAAADRWIDRSLLTAAQDISANAKTLIFTATLTCGNLVTKAGIDEITFPSASQGSRRVVFVTERCVMELRQQRLVLTELANGMSTEAAALGPGWGYHWAPWWGGGWYLGGAD